MDAEEEDGDSRLLWTIAACGVDEDCSWARYEGLRKDVDS